MDLRGFPYGISCGEKIYLKMFQSYIVILLLNLLLKNMNMWVQIGIEDCKLGFFSSIQFIRKNSDETPSEIKIEMDVLLGTRVKYFL